MLGLEPRAFIVISAAFGVLWAFVFHVMHSSFPRDIRGIAHWGRGCAVMAIAAFLFSAHDIIPVFFSSYLANLLVATGVIAMRGSIRQFNGRTRNDLPMILLLALASAALFVATFVNDDYRGRIAIMSGTLTLMFAACAMEVFRLVQPGLTERFTGFVFSATASVMLVRCVTVLHYGEPLTRAETDASPIHQAYMATFSFSIVALSVGFLLMVNARLHRKLELLAIRDQQTGVYQQDAFIALLNKEIAESRSRHESVAVLMIALDNFDDISERFGQQAVDLVMRELSGKARQVLRRSDAIGRYNEDGLLVMASGTAAAGAHAVARRILEAAAQPSRKDLPPYTASVGIAMIDSEHEEAGRIINAANRALEAAKVAGSNRIEIATDLDSRHAARTIEP